MRKKKGEVQQFFIQMLGIIFVFAIMLYGVYYSKTIIVYNNANQIARKYILKMETNGFLSEEDIENLKSDAKEAGIGDDISIDASSTKLGDAKYGDNVTLTIAFTEKMYTIDFSDFKFKSEDEPVTIKKSSVAKYFNSN